MAYSANNAGYINAANPQIKVDLRAQIMGSAPANAAAAATAGVSLGSITFTDTADESAGHEIMSNDRNTPFSHWWVYVTQNGAAGVMRLAELQFYE